MQRIPSFPPRLVVPVLCCCITGCSAARVAAPPSPPPASIVDRIDALDPQSAAARAVAVSPRVRAGALRVDAQMHRAQAMSVPPDPSIAISLGVPVDGLGGLPVSVSIMQGLAWLLQQEAVRDAAERECDAAARELVATTITVAAEARGLTRALAAAREARVARESAVREHEARLSIERDALVLGESSASRVAVVEEGILELRARAVEDLIEEQGLELALGSLLGAHAIGPIDDDDPAVPAVDVVTSLEIEQVRARLARAEAIAATAQSPWGAEVRGGLGFQRDLEDRESIGTSLELAMPVFRRESEIAAIHADVRAMHADLAEAERTTQLAAAQARTAAERQREALRLALDAAELAGRTRAQVEHAVSIGEASRAELHTIRATEWNARADAARRRIALANAIAELEARSAPRLIQPAQTEPSGPGPEVTAARMESTP